ncbi:hypothetical protein AHAS_Ahas20G0172100 [Arachis hypogaea]
MMPVKPVLKAGTQLQACRRRPLRNFSSTLNNQSISLSRLLLYLHLYRYCVHVGLSFLLQLLSDSVIKILDTLYHDRDYARFFVLETIARVPYFGPLGFQNEEYNGSLPNLVYRPYSWTKTSSIMNMLIHASHMPDQNLSQCKATHC